MFNRAKAPQQKLARYRAAPLWLVKAREILRLLFVAAMGGLIVAERQRIVDTFVTLDSSLFANASFWITAVVALAVVAFFCRTAIRFWRWRRERIQCGTNKEKRKWKAAEAGTEWEDDPRTASGKAYDLQSYGVGKLTTSWNRIPEFRGDIGREFMRRLDASTNASWYLINMSPYSYKEESRKIYELMQKATDHGTTIRWCYQVPDDVMRHPTLLHMWRWLYSHEPDLQVRASLHTLCDTLGGLSRKVEAFMRSYQEKQMGPNNKWLIYHSTAPSFYLAWLCVPGKMEDHVGLSHAPIGTFGYVMPYAHFPTYEDRPGFYFDKSEKPLEAPGRQWELQHTLLDYYFKSTIRFFEEGVKDGQFRYLYPIDARPAAMGSGYDVCAGAKQTQP